MPKAPPEKPPIRNLFVKLEEADGQRVQAIQRKAPGMSRARIARTALRIGLQTLEQDVSMLITEGR